MAFGNNCPANRNLYHGVKKLFLMKTWEIPKAMING